ncbi:rhomboid family intramembrane serine protease [Portibacter lacus]|uniref:Rhomboid family intramembrane serine protease n=1 Tax=Portibacter lacus TaxID=1099794 RepID=A0AA37SSL0_9BACT|nr:rhomboid family intramembrane serine protease [Portibacter lacus]GLR18769.1 rhomboid family intramembrane serine protease [Portibacter lacus]
MIFPIGDENVKGGHPPIFSYGFIVVNLIVFIFQLTMDGDELRQFFFTFGSIPKVVLNGDNYFSLFSSMFLHSGLMHIIGNMIFLWVFADNIEAVIGNANFLLFYLLGGLFASAGHILFNIDSNIPSVGASGAISAVLGAYIVLFPKSRIKVLFFIKIFYVSAFLFLGFWIIQQVISGFSNMGPETAQSSGVAWWAHIGGFVFGVAAGFFFKKRGYMNKVEYNPKA